MTILTTFCILLAFIQCYNIIFSLVIFYGIHLLFILDDGDNIIENVSLWSIGVIVSTLLTCFVWAPVYMVDVWIRKLERDNFHIHN